ncbi:hypothetical protein [uncultured Methanobrevibacter sp.]|uniref:hypothetical protein n=1 Tax=uncultured Methanobrevibacter sp. TaxID=253161 RepID=UPI0025FCF2E8|nr:hypothetical protein [uncultured Methanobrevibacter sp.]
MLKINRSILIICLVSLFLIMGQVTASDNDLIEINDSNASNDPMELDKMNICSESSSPSQSNDMSDLTICENYSNKADINSNDQDSDKLDDNQHHNVDDYQHILETIKEESKDTTGIVMANDNYSCGPASLATVLNSYGLNLSL